jgi:hypothetical protein
MTLRNDILQEALINNLSKNADAAKMEYGQPLVDQVALGLIQMANASYDSGIDRIAAIDRIIQILSIEYPNR